MLLTLFLLGALYVVFIAVLLTAGAGVGIMLVVVGGLALAQLLFSDKLALQAVGAKIVTPEQAPGLHAMIDGCASRQTCPSPRSPWRTPRCPMPLPRAALRRTPWCAPPTGIMNILEPHELEGVLAHELTHVKNRDVMVMTIASFFASVAAIITQFGFFFGGGFGGGDDDNGPGFAVVLLVSFAVYVISFF